MELTIKQTAALDFLEDDITEEVLYGGSANCGKSRLGCYWQLKMRLKYPGTRGLIGRAVLKTLKETTLQTFFEVAKVQGLKRDIHYWLTSAQDKEFPNCIVFRNGSLIFLKDLYLYPSDPEFDELGSLEITDAYVDECSQISDKARKILGVRVRYMLNGRKGKILYTTNPTKNWAYNDFYHPFKKQMLRPTMKFVPALPEDNIFADKGNLDKMRNMPNGPEKQRMYYGNWEYADDDSVLCKHDSVVDLFTNEGVRPNGVKSISADLAMQGRDSFIAGVWDGLVCDLTRGIDKPKATGKEIETDLKKMMTDNGVGHSMTVVDSDGLGAYLESYLKGIKEFHGGAQAIDKVEFSNLKAECGYKLAEFVNKRQMRIICNDTQKEQIIKEFGVLKVKDVDKDETRKRLISKEEMKNGLGGRSPDYLDMLIMKMIFHVTKTRECAVV